MARQVVSLAALIFSIMLLVSGNAFLMTLLGVRLSLEGTPVSVIGWVLVCYSIGFVPGTLYAGRVIERVGHIRSFAVFAAICASAALLHPMLVSEWVWALLRIVSGFSMAGLLIVIESWFSSRATNENRGRLFAVYQIVFYISVAGGQLLVNLGQPETFVPFSIAAILLTLALIPLSLSRMEAPSIERVERLPLRALFGTAPVGLVAALLSGIAINAFYTMGPVYATHIGLELHQLSIFMAVAVLAAMLFAWPLGRVCDRFERRQVMLWIATGASASCIGAALFGGFGLLPLVLFAGGFMGLTAALYPVAVAMTNDRMDSHQIVAASAALLLSYGIGSCIGPIYSALLIDLIGPSGLFVGNALVMLAVALVTRYRITHHEASVSVEEQEHFVTALPDTTSVLAEIDPRNEAFNEAGT